MKQIVSSALVFALLTGTALAAKGAVAVFKSMDADNNGKVTQTEYAEYWRQFFKRTDKNRDGVLDFDEFPDPWAFHTCDKNKDERLDMDEYDAFRARQFKTLDANKDGNLTLKEFTK